MAVPSGPVLALELSGPESSLALGTVGGEEGSTWQVRRFAGERGRALIAELDALLRSCGVRRDELEGLVTGTGPGSYTGLRIACTAARVLAAVLRIPAVGLCSFRALALRAPVEAELHILLDAYRKELYHAAYLRRADSVSERIAPRIVPRRAPSVPSGALLLGEPALAATEVRVLEARVDPDARDLLALARLDPAIWDRPAPPAPLYLRAPAFHRRAPAAPGAR